jgi:hypothetical protein
MLSPARLVPERLSPEAAMRETTVYTADEHEAFGFRKLLYIFFSSSFK